MTGALYVLSVKVKFVKSFISLIAWRVTKKFVTLICVAGNCQIYVQSFIKSHYLLIALAKKKFKPVIMEDMVELRFNRTKNM